MPDTDVLKQSVTAGDYAESPRGAYFINIGSNSNTGNLPPSLKGYSLKESDYITASTIDEEALWAGSVSIAVTKVSSLAWEVEGDIPLRTKHGHSILNMADAGGGWVSFISKLLQDFLLTNNGCFIEIVRKGTSEKAPIMGLIPLDSFRCTRTGDPQKPVIYQDLKGSYHELRAADVLFFADMPSSRASMFGTGKCAAARAYSDIYKLSSIGQYVSDKVTGRRPLAIHLINGLNDQQLQSVLQSAQSKADARGIISYMGAILATMPGIVAPGVATIPLADFPDNFNRKEELDISVLAYASNLGLDIQDIQPLTGRAMGTGAQSDVLNEKSKGKGLAAFRQQFVHGISTWVLPDSTTMVFVEKDWRDKLLQAQYNSTVEAYTANATEKGLITAQQGLQALVDENIYPEEFLPQDLTPDLTLTDTEKPGTEATIQAVQQAITPAAPEDIARLQIPKVTPIVKSKKDEAEELLEDTEDEAQALADKILGKKPKKKEAEDTTSPVPGTMKVVIKRREDSVPASKESSSVMPMLLASALLGTAMTGSNDLSEDDAMKLADFIAQFRKPKAVAKAAPASKAASVPGVEALMNEDETGQMVLTILMPADFFAQKEVGGQQDIIINIPAPVINFTSPAPVVNIPAPVVNMPAQKPPVVNLSPVIEVNMPDKKGEFVVTRDNYGNVISIEEK